jgi:hypothetical protein
MLPAQGNGPICRAYLPQVRNLRIDTSSTYSGEQACRALFDEFGLNPRQWGSIFIFRHRDEASAASEFRSLLRDPHWPLEQLGDEGYEEELTVGTHYNVYFRRGRFTVRLTGPGSRGSLTPVLARLAREIDDKLPRGDGSGPGISPPPSPPPVPPSVRPLPLPTPPSRPPPARGDAATPRSSDAVEKELLDALSGASCSKVWATLERETSKEARTAASDEAEKVRLAYLDFLEGHYAPLKGQAGSLLANFAMLGSLEDESGKALFPSARAGVVVASRLAISAATDRGALTALRRLLAMLVRLDRPCP